MLALEKTVAPPRRHQFRPERRPHGRLAREGFTVSYRLRQEWEGEIYQFILELGFSEQSFEHVVLHYPSSCCKEPHTKGWEWDRVRCSGCQQELTLPENWPLSVKLADHRGLTEKGRSELATWWELDSWDPLTSTLFVESFISNVVAACEAVVTRSATSQQLMAGVSKKFVVFPGETKKLKLEHYLESKLAEVFDEVASAG